MLTVVLFKTLSFDNKIFNKVRPLKGTISGEHGVGLTKASYVALELGAENINLTKQIKKVFESKFINEGVQVTELTEKLKSYLKTENLILVKKILN